jgi:hypothetical protein
MLIFENLYLMIEKSKNSKWGLFGNLRKRSMQWSHKMLYVVDVFGCLYLSFKNAP